MRRRLLHGVADTLAADAWARSNPETARLALRRPPKGSVAPNLNAGFESYVEERGFSLPNEEPSRSHALRLLSHALTYPLTLARCVQRSDRLRIAVLGARAESSMPLDAWAELTCALPSRWHLLLMGPQVVPTRRLAGAIDTGDLVVACRRQALGETDDLGAIFNDALGDDDPSPVDAVVLFHPGLGHLKHEAGWEGAMRSVVRAAPRALIITSFSERDQESDVAGLTHLKIPLRFAMDPQPNPFASRRVVLDPLDQTHVTTANARALVLETSSY